MKKFIKFSIVAAVMLVMIFAMTSIVSAANYTLYADDYVYVSVSQNQTATISFTPTEDNIYYFYSVANDGADPAAKLYKNGSYVDSFDDEDGRDFAFEIAMYAGEYYELQVGCYQGASGSFYVACDIADTLTTSSATYCYLPEGGYYNIATFVPEVSGRYYIYSTGNSDVKAWLYDVDGYFDDEYMQYSDDYLGNNFGFYDVYLTAGELYVIQSQAYNNREVEYYVNVTLISGSGSGGGGTGTGSSTGTIYAGTLANVYIPEYDEAYFYFTPSVSGWYEIHSSGSLDTIVSVYDYNDYLFYENDDSGDESNFSAVDYFYAGYTYTFVIDAYYSDDYGYTQVLATRITDGAYSLYNGYTEYRGYIYLQNGTTIKNKWKSVGSDWIYLGSDGYALRSQWMKDSKGWCFLDSWGIMCTDDIIRDSVGCCFVDSSGYWVTTPGWRNTVHGWIYIKSNGYLIAEQWQKDSLGWCYLDDWGIMVTDGFVEDSIGMVYLDINGRMTANRWVEDYYGNWCYVGANGYLVKNAWRKDNTGWCYLGSDYTMQTNKWIADSKGWCYVGANGYMVTNGFAQDSNGWCYLNASGYITKSQWVSHGGDWYYANASGYIVMNNWAKVNNSWYYFGSDGVMYSNTSCYINGVYYTFAANGVCLNP